jgi:cbb3-type cytochrome oxidase subunit 1
MKKLAVKFMQVAVVYGLIGLAAGVYMGMTGNFEMNSLHAHLSLLGWLSFALFAVFYHLHPEATESKMAGAHFWLANAGLVIMSTALVMLHSGNKSAEPAAGIGSIILLVSFILFSVIVFTRTLSCKTHGERKAEREIS